MISKKEKEERKKTDDEGCILILFSLGEKEHGIEDLDTSV